MPHLEHASPAILEWDGELRLARWSPRAEKLFGWRAREVIGLRPEELPFLAEQERWSLRKGLEGILAGHGERNASFVRVRTRDGIDRPCVWLSYPLLSREERPMSVLSVIHEANDQHEPDDQQQAQRQQEQPPTAMGTAAPIPPAIQGTSQTIPASISPISISPASGFESELLRSAFRHAPVGIGLIDAGGRWQLANPALCSMLGYSEQELCGTTFQEVIHPDTPDTSYLSHLIAGEIAAHHIEKHHTTRRGEQHWVSLMVLVVRDTLGRPMHFLVLAQNITERKRTEDRLREARDAAEIANRTKSEFLAMISHEIRTPMNAVIGMNSLLLETELTPKQREYVDTLLNSSNTLLRLINDILDFSKVESGKLDLEHQPFDLRICIEGALRMVAGEMSRKGIEPSYTIAEGTPSALIGDGTRLQQILVNLLTNAVKFTERGEISITVGTRGGSDGEHELLFAVHDTGIGIRQQHHDKLFKSFSQIGGGPRKQQRGTGLGLAISKLLVEMMRGRIWVESDEGKGSTFYFTIIAEGLEQRHWRESIGALKGKRLLVVDDNDETGIGLAQQLQRFEMISITVTSLEIARELIAQGIRLDAVIVNDAIAGFHPSHIAVMAGSGQEGLPVVVLSPPDASSPRTELTSSPSVSFLDRPVRQSDLFNLLLDLFVDDPSEPEQKLPSHSLVDDSMGSQLPLKILIAEDNLVNQRVACLMLENLGYQPDVAGNGIEALAALRRQRYDVVLMDVEMPEMDGLMATTQIRRELPADRQPWIIAMTANAIEGYRNFCLESGMNGYLAKPMRKEQLIEALKEASGPDMTPNSEPGSGSAAGTRQPHPLQMLYDALGTDNPVVINDMITQYLTNTAESIIYIRRKCAERNTTELTRIAHSLKSTSRVFGAVELSELFAELERLGQAGALERADSLLTSIASEFKRTQKRLEAERNG